MGYNKLYVHTIRSVTMGNTEWAMGYNKLYIHTNKSVF